MERRTLEEIRARYELEPSLEDVFVEGVFDSTLLNSYIRGTKLHSRAIYEIDTIDIPVELVKGHGLSNGNKQRVVVLARELAKVKGSSLICLIDRDLDHWFGTAEKTPRLRWTKHCSIEGHYLNRDFVHELLITAGRSKIDDFECYYQSMSTILSFLYSLRLSDRELGWSLSWIPFEKFLSRAESRVTFDDQLYIDRLLLKNGKTKEKIKFTTSASQWRKKFNCDLGLRVRGHDFVEFIAWAIQKFNGHKAAAKLEMLESFMVILAPRVASLFDEIRA